MSVEPVVLPSPLILCWDGWIAFLFCFCLQSFPASGSFPTSQLFTSGGQSIWGSCSVSVLPMSIQDWFCLELTGLISLQSKGLSGVFSNTTVQKHQIFSVQPTLRSNSHIHISYNSLTSYPTSLMYFSLFALYYIFFLLFSWFSLFYIGI